MYASLVLAGLLTALAPPLQTAKIRQRALPALLEQAGDFAVAIETHAAQDAINAAVDNNVENLGRSNMEEIRTGLVPPLGGRIVSAPSTGQTAFVGFASAIVHTSTNWALQAKNNYTVKRPGKEVRQGPTAKIEPE